MPNHVTNEIVFRGITEDQRAQITAAACNAEGEVDFGVLLPIPLNAWMGNVGQNHERAFKLTALDWCAANWGTKWNAYDQRPAAFDDGALTLIFDTAWRPPYGWLAALFNTVKTGFEHNWRDEGAEHGWCGTFKVNPSSAVAAIEWSERPAEEAEDWRLSVLKWGEETARAIRDELAESALTQSDKEA
ncbi:hypothetical protein [Brevundimonas sp. DS20]|uniref:DUF1281 family ferredoxin-like fold protein n=1 Tax=Brevundimonas sp. DS20 TaxID=1532555 RepID=UPI0006D055DE|nr:hypothetical protein [Brevundimonas sp. DS20]ALJ08269.1 hypothetical protein JL11_07880 [Brevundimonas sp. DS20]MEC7798098.1 hypothetical protein [Pseudomonadota bacterium]MED5538680.1 hypothetical protein [Pseudomonadota bacterium]